MKKNGLFAAIGALAAVVIGIVIAGCSGDASESPLSYAPKSADAIIYVNNKKVYDHKIAKKLMENPDFKKGVEKFQKDSGGITVDEMMNSESCSFITIGKEGPQFSVIARFAQSGLPEKLLNAGKADRKKNGTDEATLAKLFAPVEGKPAARVEKLTLIALNSYMLQVSQEAKCLVKGEKPALVNAVDTSAMLSCAAAVNDDIRAQIKQNAEGVIPDDITFVTANVREKGNDLVIEVVAEFTKVDSAKALSGLLITMRNKFKNDCGDKDLAKLLDDVKISDQDKKVIISLAVSSDEVIKQIDSKLKK